MKTRSKAALVAAVAALTLAPAAFACKGLIASAVGNCHLDDAWDAAKQTVPGVDFIDRTATDVGRGVGGMILGSVCQTAFGAFQLQWAAGLGDSCQVILQNGVAIAGSVVQ